MTFPNLEMGARNKNPISSETVAIGPRRGTLVVETVALSKHFFTIAFAGLTMAATVGAACSSTTGGDGETRLPERSEAGGAETSTVDAAPAESCKDLKLVVGEPAACDQCVKAKCCDSVLACTKSDDCTAVQECIAPCAQDDFLCISTCTESHPSGTAILQEIGSCAKTKCKTECASSEPPDAGGFDTGL